MTDINPFNNKASETVQKEYYLIRITEWEWVKTDYFVTGPFYDHSPEGLLFSAECECPLCEGTINIAAGGTIPGEYDVKYFCCLSCGITGDIVGRHGFIHAISEDGYEGVGLPECIIVHVLV